MYRLIPIEGSNPSLTAIYEEPGPAPGFLYPGKGRVRTLAVRQNAVSILDKEPKATQPRRGDNGQKSLSSIPPSPPFTKNLAAHPSGWGLPLPRRPGTSPIYSTLAFRRSWLRQRRRSGHDNGFHCATRGRTGRAIFPPSLQWLVPCCRDCCVATTHSINSRLFLH